MQPESLLSRTLTSVWKSPCISGNPKDKRHARLSLRKLLAAAETSESGGLPAAPARTTSVITRKRFKWFQSKQDLEVQGAGGSSGLEIVGCHGRARKDLPQPRAGRRWCSHCLCRGRVYRREGRPQSLPWQGARGRHCSNGSTFLCIPLIGHASG